MISILLMTFSFAANTTADFHPEKMISYLSKCTNVECLNPSLDLKVKPFVRKMMLEFFLTHKKFENFKPCDTEHAITDLGPKEVCWMAQVDGKTHVFIFKKGDSEYYLKNLSN
jgi:hypothetical protein